MSDIKPGDLCLIINSRCNVGAGIVTAVRIAPLTEVLAALAPHSPTATGPFWLLDKPVKWVSEDKIWGMPFVRNIPYILQRHLLPLRDPGEDVTDPLEVRRDEGVGA